MKKLLLLVCLLGLALPCRAHFTFGEMGLKELRLGLTHLQSASLVRESRLEAPWPSNIVLAEDIERFGWETLANILEYQPSFFLIQTSMHTEISLRGVYPRNTANLLFLEDGFRLNTPGFERFYPKHQYPLEEISRVEIIRGSGTSLYGDASFSGVISIKKATRLPSPEVSLLVGNHDTKGIYGRGALGDLVASVKYFDRNGEDRSLASSYDYALVKTPGKDYLSCYPRNYFWGLRYQKENLLLLFERFRYQTRNNRGIFGQILEKRDKFWLDPKLKLLQTLVGAKYGFHLGPFSWVIKGYFSRSEDERDFITGTQREYPHLPPFNLAVKYHTERWGSEILGHLHFQKGLFLLGGKIERNTYMPVKARYKLQPYAFPYSSKIPHPEGTFEYSSKQEENWALFALLKYQLTDWLLLNLGARYDHFEAFEDEISPRLAFIFRLRSDLSLVFSYAHAFQTSPYIFRIMREKHGKGDLSSEKNDQLNLSLRYQNKDRLYLALTGFYQHLENLVKREPPSYIMFSNTGQWSEAGLEFEGRYESPLFVGFLNYAWYEVLDDEPRSLVYGNRISGIPKWILKGGASFKVFSQPEIYLSPLFRYYGRTRFEGCWCPPVFLADLNLLYKRKNVSANLKIENLFDKGYKRAGTVGPYPQPGRTIWLKVRFFPGAF
ncbi:MAG: TonB-dependent receptor [Thermodesulfobacteria bacterium]|nr:TonB-dependent receptor [Thermodesulfobacteriota bacterium]